jgi:hypothetical protein
VNLHVTKLRESLSQLIGESVTEARCEIDSMLILNLGPLESIDVKTQRGKSTFYQGSGSLWSLLAAWDIKQSGKVVCDSSKNSKEQKASLVKTLIGSKLKVWNITEKLDLTLAFDNGYTLSLSSLGKPKETLWILSIRDVGEFIAEHSALTYKPQK